MSRDNLSLQTHDFVLLTGRDEYAQYYNLVCRVLERLLSWYQQRPASESGEASVVHAFVVKLLYTICVLRFKFAYREGGSLKIDLTDSGFPSAQEIAALETDLVRRTQRLQQLDSQAVLRRRLLDHLIQKGRDSEQLLWELSERAYLDLLERDRLFMSFTPGQLVFIGGDNKYRRYSYSWACYDFLTSRPFVHVIYFDQDVSQPALEKGSPTLERFLQVIRHEGSRAPLLGVLAASIDQAIEEIHPKILRRVCLGPMFAKLLVKSHDYTADPLCMAVTELLLHHENGADQEILFFDQEVVTSKRQEVTSGVFTGTRIRQIFDIDETDELCAERRATLVHRIIMLPHHLLQQIQAGDTSVIPGFDTCHVIAYTGRGEFHGS